LKGLVARREWTLHEATTSLIRGNNYMKQLLQTTEQNRKKMREKNIYTIDFDITEQNKQNSRVNKILL